MKTINVALLGCGTVGSGVVDAINMNNEKYKDVFGINLNLKKILVSDIHKKRNVGSSLLTDDIKDAINEDIDLVIEVMGGIDFAKKCILYAFKNGKSVVSANKDLIANCAKELYDSAYKNKVHFLYEASVCGGIPILRTINNHLCSEKISEVTGIVNGTTNFILTKMYQKYGLTYETVLSEAQELGYAEADPTSDVEGFDAARKIAILSSLCFSAYVNFSDVYTQGITKITPEDIKYAKKFGYNIKLLGISKQQDDTIQAHVYPAFIPHSHELSTVNDAYNAVYIKSNMLGSSMYYGAGAGSHPTASAVMSDVIEISRKILKNEPAIKIDEGFVRKPILNIDDIYSKYYVRIKSVSGKNAISKVTKTFEKSNIKLLEIVADMRSDENYNVVIITQRVKEKSFKEAINIIDDDEMKIENIVRIEEN